MVASIKPLNKIPVEDEDETVLVIILAPMLLPRAFQFATTALSSKKGLHEPDNCSLKVVISETFARVAFTYW